MDAISLLKSQHREVEDLFKQFEALGDKAGAEKKAVLTEITQKLTAHAAIEERLFYPEGRDVDEDMTLEAYEEHGVMKDLIRKIGKTRASDETFEAKATVLKEIVEHHVEEEENKYFPECEEAFGQEKLEELGEEMEALFHRLVSGTKNPRKRVAKKAKKRRRAA